MSNSPLEKWLHDLTERNIAELYIFNFIYGWLYILDNELVQLEDKNIKQNIERAFHAINQLAPDIEIEFFYEIYTDRFQRFREELSKVRKTQFSTVGYFPGYYYGRILEYSLMNNDFNSETFSSKGDWNDIQLADMFSHQINHLQDHLDQAFKK